VVRHGGIQQVLQDIGDHEADCEIKYQQHGERWQCKSVDPVATFCSERLPRLSCLIEHPENFCCLVVVQKKLEADGEKHRRWVLWKSSVGGGDTIVRKGEEMDKEDMKMIQCSKNSTLQTPFTSPPPPLSQAVLLAHTSALCIQTSFRGFLVSVLNP
jgi:hypothetical protein